MSIDSTQSTSLMANSSGQVTVPENPTDINNSNETDNGYPSRSELQAMIDAMFASCKNKTTGEYDFPQIMMVFNQVTLYYAGSIQEETKQMNTVTGMLDGLTDLQNIFNKSQTYKGVDGGGIDEQDAQNFIDGLSSTWDKIQALHSSGQIDDTAYQTLKDKITDMLSAGPNIITGTDNGIDPTVIQPDGSLDFSKSETAHQVQVNMNFMALNAVNYPDAANRISSINNDFIAVKRTFSSVSNAVQAYYHFLIDTINSWTTAENNIGSAYIQMIAAPIKKPLGQ